MQPDFVIRFWHAEPLSVPETWLVVLLAIMAALAFAWALVTIGNRFESWRARRAAVQEMEQLRLLDALRRQGPPRDRERDRLNAVVRFPAVPR